MDKQLPNATVDTHLIRGLNDLADAGTPALLLNKDEVWIPAESGLKMKSHTLARLVEHGWLNVQSNGSIVATDKGLADMQTVNNLVAFKDGAPAYVKIVNQEDSHQAVYCSRCPRTTRATKALGPPLTEAASGSATKMTISRREPLLPLATTSRPTMNPEHSAT